MRRIRKFYLFIFVIFAFLNSKAQSLSVIWPKNNEVISDRTPLFNWNGVDGVSTYQVSISLDSTFSSGVQQFSSSTESYQLTTNLVSGIWFWKVNTVFNSQSLVSNLGKFQVFEPTDISSLCLWLRADTNLILDANGRVQQWKDLSYSGLIFNQNTVSKRPFFNSSGFNNKPVLTFNGAQVLSGGDVLDLGTTSRSMFVMGNYTNTTSNGYFYAKALFGPAGSRFGFGGGSNNLFSFYLDNLDRTAQLNPGSNYSNNFLYSSVINRQNNTNSLRRNSSVLAINSNLLASHNMNSTFRFLIGAYNDATDISETLYLNGNISGNNLNFTHSTATKRPTFSPSKLIDYAITERPILNVNPTDPNKERLVEFLSSDYQSGYIIEKITRYKISNVVFEFLKLI